MMGNPTRWRAPALLAAMVASLAGLAMMSQFFRSMVAVIAPTLIVELGLSGTEISVIAGAFFIAMALFQLPVGLLMDRFGPRRTIVGMVTFAVAGAAVFSQATSAAGLFLGMLLIGTGCAPVIIGSVVLVARWMPADRFALAFALITATSNVGGLLSSAPLAYAAEGLGWRGAILTTALLTLALGGLAFLFVRDAPPGHPFHSRKVESVPEMLRGLWQVLSTRAIWLLLGIPFVGYSTLITIRGLWAGPYFADVHGLDTVARGQLLLMMAIGLVVGAVAYGPADRWFDTRKWVILPGAAVTVTLLATLALLPHPALWQVTALFVAISIIGTYYLLGMAHLKSLFPDWLTGRAVTTLNLATFTGVSVMQPVTGLIMDAVTGAAAVPPEQAYRAVFAFQAGVVALAALVYSRARDVRPSQEAAARARGGG